MSRFVLIQDDSGFGLKLKVQSLNMCLALRMLFSTCMDNLGPGCYCYSKFKCPQCIPILLISFTYVGVTNPKLDQMGLVMHNQITPQIQNSNCYLLLRFFSMSLHSISIAEKACLIVTNHFSSQSRLNVADYSVFHINMYIAFCCNLLYIIFTWPSHVESSRSEHLLFFLNSRGIIQVHLLGFMIKNC